MRLFTVSLDFNSIIAKISIVIVSDILIIVAIKINIIVIVNLITKEYFIKPVIIIFEIR